MRPSARPLEKTRSAFTLIELLVVLSVIGILTSLILPAVQQAREAARQTSCRNNLRQLGLALMNFESAHRRFPPGRDAKHEWNYSWTTAVLPYLEQQALYTEYDDRRPWNDPDNASVAGSFLPSVRCPSAVGNWPGKTDYGGNYGSVLTGLQAGFGYGRAWESGTLVATNVQVAGAREHAVSLGDIQDGTSNTFLVVEDADRPPHVGGMWADGNNCLAHDNGPVNNDPANEIHSLHPGGAFVLLSDGSARFLSESVDLRVLGAYCTRASGEIESL